MLSSHDFLIHFCYGYIAMISITIKSYSTKRFSINIGLLTYSSITIIPSYHSALVYNPPNTGLLYQQKLTSFLSDIMQTDEKVILLGDFNTPDIDWHTLTADSNFSIQLCNLIFQYNYSLVVTSLTHEHGNLLDFVITKNGDIISDV